jgi:hypothetical protein
VRARGGDGGLDVGAFGLGRLGDLLRGHRVDDVDDAASLGRPPLAIDVKLGIQPAFSLCPARIWFTCLTQTRMFGHPF